MSEPHTTSTNAKRHRTAVWACGVGVLLLLAGALPGYGADNAPDGKRYTKSLHFKAGDGAVLQAYLTSADKDFPARPVIIEFSPYAPTSFKDSTGHDFGPAYNYVEVQDRGTGKSTGNWSALGPRDQKDVVAFVAWACEQPWSNGHIGLYGFSASAIAVYNAMHLPLNCVDAAALMAGTADLYRDLIYPGGIFNLAPAAYVGGAVSGPLLADGLAGLLQGQSPINNLQSQFGLGALLLDVTTHTTEDRYWRQRTLRPGPNDFPVLADTSFYDVEPRGPFQAYQALRDKGSHLIVFGAHDGFPAGTPGPFPQYKRWFDHYLRGIDNAINREPRVQLLVGRGSREAYMAGHFTRINADDWPVPGTRWQSLYLSAQRAHSGAGSVNDASLKTAPPAGKTSQAYLPLVSLFTATDPHTTAVLAGIGAAPLSFATLFDTLPFLTETNVTDLKALTYTTRPLSQDVDVVGPAALDVYVSNLLPSADIYAVLSDVWPDGSAHPVGVSRLRTDFPGVDRNRSLTDAGGNIVQPYGYYCCRNPAALLQTREYHVEFWPIGNRFAAGHRLRLSLLGTAVSQLPAAPANINQVFVGGMTPSRLLLPVLPGNTLSLASP